MKVWCVLADNGEYEAASLVEIYAEPELAEAARAADPGYLLAQEWEVTQREPEPAWRATWRVTVDCFVDNGTPFGAWHHQVRHVVTAGRPDLAELLGEHAGHVLADVRIERFP